MSLVNSGQRDIVIETPAGREPADARETPFRVAAPHGVSPRARWPIALAAAVGGALLLSLATFAVARSELARGEHKMLILGDSVVAGFRCGEGECIEDRLNQALGSAWVVRNFAEPGAQVADYYLKFAKAELLGFHPEVVILTVPPKKLIRTGELDEDGANLQWLPLTREGMDFYSRRSPRLRALTLVRKASLLFAFYDALHEQWVRRFEWPGKRRAMHRDSYTARRTRMLEGAKVVVEGWDKNVGSARYEELVSSNLSASPEFDFLLDVLARRHIRVLVMIPPWPRASLVEAGFPEESLRKLDLAHSYAVRWCANHRLPAVDLASPEASGAFEAKDWDDFQHVWTPRAFELMAAGIRDHLSALAETSQ